MLCRTLCLPKSGATSAIPDRPDGSLAAGSIESIRNDPVREGTTGIDDLHVMPVCLQCCPSSDAGSRSVDRSAGIATGSSSIFPTAKPGGIRGPANGSAISKPKQSGYRHQASAIQLARYGKRSIRAEIRKRQAAILDPEGQMRSWCAASIHPNSGDNRHTTEAHHRTPS